MQKNYIMEPDAKLAFYAHMAQAENDLKHGRVQNMDDAINDILSELNGLEKGGRATVCKAIELYGEQRELAGKKEMAISLGKQGVAIEVIAEAAGVAKEVVKQWLTPVSA